ncbi:MAG: SHOCT domain-containing protein [bacterium]|nr:SHOCT domain-containing protein [bacterium]
MMYGYGLDGGWYGHALFGGFFMIIFWVAVIFFVVWIVREVSASNKKQDGREHHGKVALDLLKERYVKGEIDRKEFEEKKKDLAS